MTETLRNCRAAYERGALSTVTGEACPYCDAKPGLQHWWTRGQTDANHGTLDAGLCTERTLRRLGLSNG